GELRIPGRFRVDAGDASPCRSGCCGSDTGPGYGLPSSPEERGRSATIPPQPSVRRSLEPFDIEKTGGLLPYLRESAVKPDRLPARHLRRELRSREMQAVRAEPAMFRPPQKPEWGRNIA